MAERVLDAFCHASRVFGCIFVLRTIPTRNEGLLVGASFDRGSWEGYGTVCLTMLVFDTPFLYWHFPVASHNRFVSNKVEHAKNLPKEAAEWEG